jgi:hypothetical protein
MALVSPERARCSDPSLTKLLAQGALQGAGVLERTCCSDSSFTKLLAHGELHGAGVPGESAMF